MWWWLGPLLGFHVVGSPILARAFFTPKHPKWDHVRFGFDVVTMLFGMFPLILTMFIFILPIAGIGMLTEKMERESNE